MFKYEKSAIALAISAALGLIAAPAYAAIEDGFEAISDSGTPVLTECAGIPDSSEDEAPFFDEEETPDNPCELDSDVIPATGINDFGPFPGLDEPTDEFWRLIRKVNFFDVEIPTSISANGSTIGWYIDRVYQRYTNGNTANPENKYVIATYLHLDPEAEWDEPNDDNLGLPGTNNCNSETDLPFEVNDIYRNIGSDESSLQVAFRMSPTEGFDSEAILYASGRTNEGVAHCIGTGEASDNGTQTCPGFDPDRDNNRVNFRADVSPEDEDGTAPPNSMWYYVYVETPDGIPSGRTANAASFESGGEELQCRYRINGSAWVPN